MGKRSLEFKVQKRHYVRLFKLPENEKKAIDMINSGCSVNVVALLLHCDRTAIIAFQKRKIEQGIIFSETKEKILFPQEYHPKEESPVLEEKKEEKVNSGKDYKEYLVKYVHERDKLQKTRMDMAKETMKELKKWRKKNGMNYDDIWNY